MMREMDMNYSVLMSVYYKEDPEYLRESMESILHQTIPTNDFVLVCDGPLNEKLDAVILDMQEKFNGALHVVRLAQNGGLGNALNVGIKHCRNDIVARMDSDDISHPDRCEKELKVLENEEIDIVSAGVQEFVGNVENVDSIRIPPETQEEILAFAKKRNPFNHPCVMYRKSAVEDAGGYQDFYLLEDYYLWLRMLLNGSKGYNIQTSLLWMRAGSEMYKRRSGSKYAASQRKLFKFMKERGMISTSGYCISCVIRTCSSLAPNWLRRGLFKKFLRKKEAQKA